MVFCCRERIEAICGALAVLTGYGTAGIPGTSLCMVVYACCILSMMPGAGSPRWNRTILDMSAW